MRRKFITLFLCILVLLPASTVSAQQNSGDPVYIVQAGDTLSSIAVRFGISVNDLLEANGITDPNALGAGQSLVLPGFEGISGTLVNETVPLGDTLRSVSLKNAVDISILTRLNRIVSPLEVYAGTSLIVPDQPESSRLNYAGSVIMGQSLLEFAVLKGTDPWTLQIDNRLAGAWDAVSGETLYAVNLQDSTSPISTAIIQDVSLTPLPLVQGGTAVVRVKSTADLTLSGTAADYPLYFFKSADDEYVALLGIHAMHDTGLMDVSIDGQAVSGETIHIEQNVLLAPGDYIQEYVEGVDSNTISADVIESEDKFLSTLIQESSEKMWNGPFSYPVDDPCMASSFGNRRSYNNGSYHYYHTGLDFIVCAPNLNIYAAAPGTVIFTGPLDIKGNFTIIDHGWGVYTGYAHQSEFLVNQGDHVDAGQLIGQIGTTGRSVGPHLHFEVWIDGTPVNPADWLENSYP